MRFIKTIFSALFMMCFISISSWAQGDRYSMFVVHEDQVKENMMDKHHEADKKIIKAAKDQNLKGTEWITFVADDNRVLYLSPIKNMAELDKNPFEDLQKKMGDEGFEKLFDSYANTYSKHGDYILRLDSELSYMPDGMTTTPEGEQYRELTFYHIAPGQGKKAEELARSVKKLYAEKNADIEYRLYKSGFGTMGDFYMVAVAAESPEHMEQKRKKTLELTGEEGKAIFDEIESTFSNIETVTGYIKPELSYVNN